MTTIYLDYNASTPIGVEAAAAMRPLLQEAFGNPSSAHWAGRPARVVIDRARGEVATLLNCDPAEVVFTSGGTESNNCALKGVYFANRERGNHIITSQIEHPAILAPCQFLERLGAEVTRLPVDRDGLVDPDDVRRAIGSRTILVSVMHANNETGTIQPIAEIAAIARAHGVLCHTDAAQSVGKIATDVRALGVDLLSVAGHKLYAPKGVGALFVRSGVSLEPLLHGAAHEAGRRAGTESALLVAGLGAACAAVTGAPDGARLRALRDGFWTALQRQFGHDVTRHGHPDRCLPNTLYVSFAGRIGAEVLARIPELAASTGSACHSGEISISPVLRAMGVEPRIGAGAIRFSLGRATTSEELDRAVALLRGAIPQ